jgi:hypothetical protein
MVSICDHILITNPQQVLPGLEQRRRQLSLAHRRPRLTHKTRSTMIARRQKLFGRTPGASSLRVDSGDNDHFNSLYSGLSKDFHAVSSDDVFESENASAKPVQHESD